MSVEFDKTAIQYLTFKLGEEMFALDVAKVREVLDFTTITRIPQAPVFMRGVINVRGSVVPVVDLHIKFGQPAAERTVDTRIVVMEVELDGDITVIGALADAVQNVLDLVPDQIEKPPAIGAGWNRDMIKGIGKHDDQFVIILDANQLFSTAELTGIQDKAIPEAHQIHEKVNLEPGQPAWHPVSGSVA